MIRVAHSPDSDDFFMFWGIVNNVVKTDGLAFSFEQFDTATLNALAASDTYDVLAISAARYASISDRYAVLPHGASVGRNYGPVVVSSRPLTVQELNTCTIAVPGVTTTAATVLRKIAPNASTIEVPIEPFALVFEYLNRGDVDAAILIHEGQISYRKRALHKVVDIGEWWFSEFKLPLPLGINVIKRSLGDDAIKAISNCIRQSIAYGLENREAILNELVQRNTERNADLTSTDGVEEYLGRYANDDTADMDEACLQSLRILLGEGTPIHVAP